MAIWEKYEKIAYAVLGSGEFGIHSELMGRPAGIKYAAYHGGRGKTGVRRVPNDHIVRQIVEYTARVQEVGASAPRPLPEKSVQPGGYAQIKIFLLVYIKKTTIRDGRLYRETMS